MLLAREHLTVLLNALYERERTVTVEHPCAEVGELLRVELGDPAESTVQLTSDRGEYEAAREEVQRRYGDVPVHDLPGEEHYVRALVAGGLLDVENRDAIRTFLTRHGYPDLDAGHVPVAAGFDTNLLPWRITDVLGVDPDAWHRRDERPPTNGFVLASGVYDELDMDFRHHGERSLVDAFGPAFERLSNQPTGAKRQGQLGRHEYRRLRDHRYAETIDCEPGDETIVEAYRSYDEARRKRVLLFSNDYGFVDRATEAGVHAQHVAFPRDLPRETDAGWVALGNTLYVLAVCFGALQLPGVTLYGAWNGKQGDHWQAEQLALEPQSPPVEERLERGKAVVEAYDG